MRIITVEEHFEHPDISVRVAQLAGPPPIPSERLAEFANIFCSDADAKCRLGGNRLAHMDQMGIDVQVVSHGNGSPSNLNHPEAVDLCRRVNDDLRRPDRRTPAPIPGIRHAAALRSGRSRRGITPLRIGSRLRRRGTRDDLGHRANAVFQWRPGAA